MGSITYDSINKILTVSNVASNSIFEDIYQADIANGWNVFKKVFEKVYYYEDILLEIKNSVISTEGDTLNIKNTSTESLKLRLNISNGSFEFKRCTFNFININNEGKAQFYPSDASLFKNCVFNCPIQRNGSYEMNSSGTNGTVFEECYIDMYFPITNAKFKNSVFAGNHGYIVNPQNGQIFDNVSFYRPSGWCLYVPQTELTINKGIIDAQYFALMRDTEKLKMLDVNLIKKDFQYFYDDGYEGDLEIAYTVDFRIYDENGNEITKNIKIYDKDNNVVYDGINQKVELFEYTYHIIGDGTVHNVYESDLTKYLPYKFEVYDELKTYYEGYITELTPNKLIEVSITTPERNIFNDIDELKTDIQTHRNAVEPKIDTTISSRLASNDSRLDNLDVSISSRSSHSPADVWNYSNRELTNPDNYKADVSDLAKESTVQTVKSQTDKLKFNIDNDVIATLDGETVNLTTETEAQIDNIENNVTNTDQYKADVSNLALESTVQIVKNQTDKLQFDTNNNVKSNAQNSELANLDETVSSRASQDSVDLINNKLSTLVSDIWSYSSRTLTSFGNLVSNIWSYVTRTLTETVSISNSDKDDIVDRVWDELITDHVIDGTFGAKNQNKVPSENINDYKADVSNLALETTVQAVKLQTDKFKFNTENDVVATLDGETVTLSSDTESQIDEIESAVNQIKTKTDNLPNDPASDTNINNAKDSIITEIQLNRNLINELLDIEEGNWEIKNNQMIFYKRDGSELIRFNLYDKDGNLTETKVYKRVRL